MTAQFLLLVLLFVPTHCQHDNCSIVTSCSKCLTLPSCVWCSTPSTALCLLRGDIQRCNGTVVDPHSNITIDTVPLDQNHQVSASSVKLKLRVGDSQAFTVSVQASKNFPVDIYMLMDSSASFVIALQDFKSVASQLITSLSHNLSTSLRVGFGAFVDKEMAPFNAPVALRLLYTVNGQPSACPHRLCKKPFGYQHVVNLTNSTEELNNAVQDLVISTSSDSPDSTLDAMMQVVVCTDIVKWRENARKILLVMTDDIMHTAGDGRLAGIYKSNDARCHTQFDQKENGIFYSTSTEYDYPSLEQMKVILERFGVVPIFAISGNSHFQYFVNISQILGISNDKVSSLVFPLSFDNLFDLVKQAYHQLIDSATLVIPNHDYLQVQITPNCPSGSFLVPGGCSGLANEMVNFSVNVTLTHCSAVLQNSGKEVLTARINGGFLGKFTLEIQGHCACDCETMECTSLSASCPKGPNGQVCSERGTCQNGMCICIQPNITYPGVDKPVIFGPSCECDNFLCDHGPEGLVCGGNGVCKCTNGTYSCSCTTTTITGQDTEGTACQCNSDYCIDPLDSCRNLSNVKCSVCFNHGICKSCSSQLAACECHSGFYGQYCQHQYKPQCTADENCIQCYSRADNSATDCQKCTGYLSLDQPQLDGYQVMSSIPNTTVSCQFSGQNGYIIHYYTARALVDGKLLFEVETTTVSSTLPALSASLITVGFLVLTLVIIVIVSSIALCTWSFMKTKSTAEHSLKLNKQAHCSNLLKSKDQAVKNTQDRQNSLRRLLSISTGVQLLLIVFGLAGAKNTIDTVRPIVKLSPVKDLEQDEFGFSVAAHKLNGSTSGFKDTLKSTLIIVGAPLGRYPGGLDLPLNSTVCALFDEENNITRNLSTLTEAEIRECYLRTGLVYSCPLNENTNCGPILGNMDAFGPDGALFDHVGNTKQETTTMNVFAFMQDKDYQKMGSTVFSSGEFFVACAPFWHRRNSEGFAPVGSCVFSAQNLENFQYTKPCSFKGANNILQESFCLTGTSAVIKGDQLSGSVLAVSTPVRFDATGGLYYYNNLSSTNEQTMEQSDLELGPTRKPTIGARTDRSLDSLPYTPINVPSSPNSLYGFSIQVGHFNGANATELFLASAPKFMDGVGQVSVVTTFSEIPTISVTGEQFGEYFGYSLATPDLNGDGYDDLVVGAPIYAEVNRPDLGRIFIYQNNNGQELVKRTAIAGKAPFGHFGHALTSLGDLNNDGYDDIAVSAPFDDGGKVFVYYGSNSTTIIDTSVQQVITAEQMVKQITNLTALKGFGFSLDGKVDVDDNGYRDLVVSAVDNTSGQAVFVLRSFPVVEVTLNVTHAPAEINYQLKECNENDIPISCFNFTICGTCDSCSDLSRINFTLEVQENVYSQQSRVLFKSNDSNTHTGILNISTSSKETSCLQITTFIKNNVSASQRLHPVSLNVSLPQFERTQSGSPINTNYQPDDLSAYPVIRSVPVAVNVPFANCPVNLAMQQTSITFLNSSGGMIVDRDVLIVGEASQVVVDLSISDISIGEDILAEHMFTFQLPTVFTSPTVTVNNVPSTLQSCASNKNSATCLRTRFLNNLSNTASKVQLRWYILPTVYQEAVKDNPSVGVYVSLRICQTSKNVTVNIPIISKTQVEIESPQQHTIQYLSNQTATSISPDFKTVTVSFWLRNRGPSPLHNATLKILLPFSIPGQMNRYYLYPHRLTVDPSHSVICSENGIIDPDNLQNGAANQQTPHGNLQQLPLHVNCSSNPGNCQELSCQLTNVTARVVFIGLAVIVDERVFLNMHDVFTLVTSTRVIINSDVNEATSMTIKLTRAGGQQMPFFDSFPLYAMILFIIGCILSCILLLVLLAILIIAGHAKWKYSKNKKSGIQAHVTYEDPMEMMNVADTDDHVTYEAIQDATETRQRMIDVDINVAYAGVVPQDKSQQQGKQLDTAAPKIATSATNFQFQAYDNPITERNITYDAVEPQNEMQESQQQGEQYYDTAVPQTAASATNFQFQSYDNPITERNIAYGAVEPQREAQEKQQLASAHPQTTTSAANNQFPDYDYPTTEQVTSEAVYDNPDFQETPKSADLPVVSAVSTTVVDDPSPYYI